MRSLHERLRDNFVLINLGAGGDTDYAAPPDVLNAATVLELDAGNQPIQTTECYHRRIRVRDFVSDTGGPRTFYKRAYWGCSGLVPTRDDVLARYGVQSYYQLKESVSVPTKSLLQVLSEHGLHQIDFLKTDLEGLDFAVVKSVENLLPTTLAVQCELRYDPFHVDEPTCEEVTLYLRKQGFEVVGLKPEYWKPQHPNWTCIQDGNIVWADFLLFRCPSSVRSLCATSGDTLGFHKQVILAAILGKFNYACHLCYQYAPHMQRDEAKQLMSLLPNFPKSNPKLMGSPFSTEYPHVADPAFAVSH